MKLNHQILMKMLLKKALTKELALPEIISKNLAELKANKVSLGQKDRIVLGADSVIDLEWRINI